MSLVNRVIVTCRLDNGDSIDVSAKSTKLFTSDDMRKLRGKINKQFAGREDDILYYQVRTWGGSNGKDRRNWSRVAGLERVYEILEEVMFSEASTD